MAEESYEIVNFALRPAKNVERKMLCDAFRRLVIFHPLEDYEYIGFGAIYFTDFKLFHRALGMKQMISIERVKDHKARFNFNRPFKCVEILYGESGEHLPKLDWDENPKIIWLDYDEHLKATVIDDVHTVCTFAQPGTMLVISVNAEKRNLSKDLDPDLKPTEHLALNVQPYKTPSGLTNEDVSGWNLASTYRTIVRHYIDESLLRRNAGNKSKPKLYFQQLFNFTYQDGAKMLTVGGLLYDATQRDELKRCAFEKMSFYSPGKKSYRIEVPPLTRKEIAHLDQLLPKAQDVDEIKMDGVKPRLIKHYAQVYRHYPNFMEVDA